MSQSKPQSLLMKFKTLILLAILFTALGAWLLPNYYTVHYRSGDDTSAFPVLVARYYGSNQEASPELTALGDLTGTENLQKEAIDFEDDLNNQHIYFAPVTKNGQTHYEIKAVTPIQTTTATYLIVDNKPQPLYQRASGLTVWTQAFFITLILAVLILVLQIALSLVKSANSSHRKKSICSRKKDKP